MATVTAGAAALRLPRLDNRPMHCDEAVQAVKFGQLLESGRYVYDPTEYHGPSLNYLTLPIAWAASTERLSEVSEIQLRLLPALFGIALVALVWLVRAELGRPAALGAAVLTAVSPAMVFFSRYYIHEMLLVAFTFAAMVALWRYARATGVAAGGRSWLRRIGWLVLLGVSVGMMHATKETCVVPLLAMGVAALVTLRAIARTAATGPEGTPSDAPGPGLLALGWPMLVVALPVAAGVSALLFSSLGQNPGGILDSFTTYAVYLGRGAGHDPAAPHCQPWPYYLRVLFWWHRDGGPVFGEAPVAALALVGLVAGFAGRGLRPTTVPVARFLGIYTLVMIAVYSAIPYKTPWCALGMLHGAILLAGVGMAVLVRIVPGTLLKAAVIGLLAVAVAYLAWQAHRASFVLYEDPDNPYVYSPTSSDVPLLAQRIRAIAAASPDGLAMHVQVICPDNDCWPLPWYLRDLTRVGYFSQVPEGPAAPLIVTQPAMREAVLDYVYVKQPPGKRYLRKLLLKPGDVDWQLRPNVPLLVLVRPTLLDADRP